MELRHLRYFIAVAEELSFTRAAAKLHLAQPSLTRQIHNLEEELEVPLFRREKNRITLTADGQFFLSRARRLLSLAAQDVHDLHRHSRGDAAGLNIAYAADMSPDLLPATLSAFRKVCPDVALNLLNLTPVQQFQALNNNEVDAGFVREVRVPTASLANAELASELIGFCNVLAVLPETHATVLPLNAPVRLEELAARPFITLPEAHYPGTRDWLIRVCHEAGFTPRIAHEADRSSTIINLVALDMGVALLPEVCLQRPHDGTAFRPLAEAVRSSTHVVWRKENDSRPLGRYLDIVRERFTARGLADEQQERALISF